MENNLYKNIVVGGIKPPSTSLNVDLSYIYETIISLINKYNDITNLNYIRQLKDIGQIGRDLYDTISEFLYSETN